MHRTVRLATATAPLVLLLALGACAPGSPAPGPTAQGPSVDSADDTACITSQIWSLDVADAAAQIAAQLSSNGIVVLSSEGSGRHTVTFTEDGLVSSSVDVSYIITTDAQGLSLAMVQTHGGESGGEWFWRDDSGVIGFENWDNSGYTVQTTTIINGVESPTSTEVPSETLAGTDMTVLSCTADALSTQVASSPFVQRWRPAD